MKKPLIYSLIAVIGLGLVAGGVYASKRKGAAKDDITIRYLSSASTPDQWELARKLTGRDILAEEKVKLEPITSVAGGAAGTTALQALVAGNVDTAGSAWPAWINIVASGGKIRSVLGTTVSTRDNKSGKSGLLVLEDSPIRAIRDLAGKRIAVNVLGAEADYVIRQYLKKEGLSIDQVQLVVVPSENQEQMLRTRQVDAVAWTSNGGIYFDMTVENGGVREIPGTRNYDIKGEVILFGIGFRNDFIEKHPDTVRRYVKAYDTARRIVYDEFQKDPARVRQAYAEISAEKGGNPKLARYFDASSWNPRFPLIVEKDLQWWIDRFVEDGQLKPGQVRATDVFTNEFNPLHKK